MHKFQTGDQTNQPTNQSTDQANSFLKRLCLICLFQLEEVQANRLRELTEQGFSLERARQALAAVGDGSIEQAGSGANEKQEALNYGIFV